MKIDVYTKIVLSVIAGCLIFLCVNRPSAVVHADNPMPVNIVAVSTTSGALPVGIVGTAWKWNDPTPPLPASGQWIYLPVPVHVVPNGDSQNPTSNAQKPTPDKK
jgi:hypothetical protein